VAVVKLLHCRSDEPTSETVWLKSWQVPVTERISNPGEWRSILEELPVSAGGSRSRT
jgi:hypothetical protein